MEKQKGMGQRGINCAPKINGVRARIYCHCIKPVYNSQGKLIRGCGHWEACKEEAAIKDISLEGLANLGNAVKNENKTNRNS